MIERGVAFRGMWILLEISIIILVFGLGCRRRSIAVVFLSVVVAFLAIFTLTVGNPVGLLASGGGWLILDTSLGLAAVAANLLGRPKR